MTQAPPQLPGLTNVSSLGSGGFADVFRARHDILGRYVAVKVFRVALDDAAAAQQFRAECQAVIRLQDEPNALRVFDANLLDDGRPYLVSELCDSSLLRLVERHGARPAGEVAEIGGQIAGALAAAHVLGVLHGDVTPQNILLRSTGAPVLADFGLAVLRDYRGNVAAGFNPVHAAPETVRYDGALDERTDVYGLGSTLYFALTGQPPFPLRPGEQEIERSRRILAEQPGPPVGAPPGIGSLLLAMLAKDPADRPSMAEVAARLTGGTPVPTAPAGPPGPPRYGPPPGVTPTSVAASVVPAAPVARAPSYAPPPAPVQDATRNRAAAPVPGASGTARDVTRLRAQRPPQTAGHPLGDPSPWWRRTPVVVAGASTLVAAAGLAAWLFLGGQADEPPAAAAQGGARIQLAVPQDDGSSVTLRWTGPPNTDYAVLIEGDGRIPALVGRDTEHTFDVQPGTPYCFRVQGSTSGQVAESNVHAIRGAVCSFVP